MDEAEKKVREEALNPKKRNRTVNGSSDNNQVKSLPSKWVKDEWGNQGEVFFDGYNYWGIFLKPSETSGITNVVDGYWTPEKWEERKNKNEIEETPSPTQPIDNEIHSDNSTPTKCDNSPQPTPSVKTPKTKKAVITPKQKSWKWSAKTKR